MTYLESVGVVRVGAREVDGIPVAAPRGVHWRQILQVVDDMDEHDDDDCLCGEFYEGRMMPQPPCRLGCAGWLHREECIEMLSAWA